jgi:hypothetical protein
MVAPQRGSHKKLACRTPNESPSNSTQQNTRSAGHTEQDTILYPWFAARSNGAAQRFEPELRMISGLPAIRTLPPSVLVASRTEPQTSVGALAVNSVRRFF